MLKPYETISENIKERLEREVESDPYGLRPETLYKNICGTLMTTPAEKAAEIFEVPYSLVLDIQRQNQPEDNA